MSQEFYNLDEAAKKLGLTTQELNAMAQHREIRAFADRGTWRFKATDIEELATRKGLVSKPQFRIDEPAGKSAPKDVMAERGPASGGPGSGKGSPSGGTKSSPGKGDTGRVDLASIAGEGDDAPQSSSFVFGNKPVAGMTDLAGPASPVHPDDDTVVPLGSDPSITSPGDSRVRLDSPSGRLPDMGVHLVDFNMKPISDPPSSRKLVPPPIPPSTAKVAGSTGTGKVAQGKPDTGKAKPDTGNIKKRDTGRIPPPSGKSGAIGSSEYDLKPAQPGPSDSIFDFTAPSMPEINLELGSPSKEAVDLGGTPMSPAQGGSMRAKLPEMGEDSSSTFELNLEPSSEEMKAIPRTPRPASTPKDTSSEFDLSLQAPKESSSDFELSVDESSGSMSALESSIPEDSSSPGSRTAKIPSEEVQVGEDSDFELALDEDASSGDETGSEVVVIEDEQSPTEAAPAKRRGEEEEAVVEPYEEAEEEEEVAAGTRTAEWGWISLVHVPTVLLMLFTGLMLFEMVRSISGYETKSTYTGAMFKLVESITK